MPTNATAAVENAIPGGTIVKAEFDLDWDLSEEYLAAKAERTKALDLECARTKGMKSRAR